MFFLLLVIVHAALQSLWANSQRDKSNKQRDELVKKIDDTNAKCDKLIEMHKTKFSVVDLEEDVKDLKSTIGKVNDRTIAMNVDIKNIKRNSK